jgi:hypothetical protein
VAGGADCGDGPRAGSESCRSGSEACRAGRAAAGGHDSYAIAVALFAAFVVGGILAKAVPLWLVAVIGLVIGAAVFVFVDRYPRLPRSQ